MAAIIEPRRHHASTPPPAPCARLVTTDGRTARRRPGRSLGLTPGLTLVAAADRGLARRGRCCPSPSAPAPSPAWPRRPPAPPPRVPPPPRAAGATRASPSRPATRFWTIARRLQPTGDVRPLVDELIALNGTAAAPARRADHGPRLMGCARGGSSVGGVRCPACGSFDDKVIDSRQSEDGLLIRRRRACLACERRFTTFERLEEVPLYVLKRSGDREPFDAGQGGVRPGAGHQGPAGRRRRPGPHRRRGGGVAAARGRRGDQRPASAGRCSSTCAASTSWPPCASPASTRSSTTWPTSSGSSTS